MSIPQNIDLFNRFSLAVFQELYLKFPVEVDLDVQDIIMRVTPTDGRFEETFDALSMGGDALNFLASEGFLTHKGSLQDNSQYFQVRLTMKGLAVLGSIPSSLEKQESLISEILAVSGKGLKEAASEQVQSLASQVFSLALVAAPSIAAMLVRP